MPYTMKFIVMVCAAFFARVKPVSTSAKPACMNITRKPATSVQTKLMATVLASMSPSVVYAVSVDSCIICTNLETLCKSLRTQISRVQNDLCTICTTMHTVCQQGRRGIGGGKRRGRFAMGPVGLRLPPPYGAAVVLPLLTVGPVGPLRVCVPP